jgi:hypothetical protein
VLRHPIETKAGAGILTSLPSLRCKIKSLNVASTGLSPSMVGFSKNPSIRIQIFYSLFGIRTEPILSFNTTSTTPVRLHRNGALVYPGAFLVSSFGENKEANFHISLRKGKTINLSRIDLNPQLKCQRCRNLDLLPIILTYRLLFRTRLTLRGVTLLRKPWVYGGLLS